MDARSISFAADQPLSRDSQPGNAAVRSGPSNGFRHLVLADGEFLFAGRAIVELAVGHGDHPRGARGAPHFVLPDPDQRPDEGRKDGGENHRHSQDRAQPREAQQRSDDDQNRGGNHVRTSIRRMRQAWNSSDARDPVRARSQRHLMRIGRRETPALSGTAMTPRHVPGRPPSVPHFVHRA